MNIQLVIKALVLGLILSSCNSSSSNDTLVERRIIQQIESDAWGMNIPNLKIESIEQVNDSTFKGVHSFSNPMFDRDVRVTRNYFFTADLDSITNKEELKTEIKSEGEWVETGF